ncbi:MAG TPA: hypothetical protein GX709_02165 [Clostridiales bacterium]|nr:hypothetical protein [Clostridiales bacterium]
MQERNKDPYNKAFPNESDGSKKLKAKNIVIIVAVIVIAVTALVLGLVFGLKKTPPQNIVNMSTQNNSYCFAMKESDESFTIPMSIFEDNPIDAFDIEIRVIENYIKLENNVVKIVNKLDKNSEIGNSLGEIIFRKNNDTYITVYMKILREEVIEINSLSDFKAIPQGAEGIYLQKNNINLEGQEISIKDFKGEYYGNHNKLIGLNVSNAGGLFESANDANLAGINLVNFKYENIDESIEHHSIGLLANTMTNTNLISIKANGEILYKNSKINSERVISIGGIVGNLMNESKDNYIEVKGCQSDVDINVSASGHAIYIGGLIGNVQNVFIEDVKSFGKINYEFSKEGTQSVYAGGIAGFLKGKVDGFSGSKIPLDMGWFFESHMDIKINVEKDSIMFRIGGIIGKMIDYQLYYVNFAGNINVDCEKSEVIAGNIAGEVENTVFNKDQKRTILISQVTIENPIEVNSDGILKLGSLVGVGISQYVSNDYGIIFSDYPTILANVTRKTEIGESKETINKSPIGKRE